MDDSSTATLTRQFTLAYLLATVFILGASGLGVQTLLQNYIISDAERTAISISQSLATQKRALLMPRLADKQNTTPMQRDEIQDLDESLRDALDPFGIVKIKVFDLTGLIIYSSDHSIIGKVDRPNPRLEVALRGGFDSKMETKESVADLKLEARFDVDVVESYVPVYDQRSKVIGSFEIYLDTTHYREEIANGVIQSLLFLSALLGLVFLVTYMLLKRTQKHANLAKSALF